MSFTLHRIKKRLQALLSGTADWALFVGLVLILGLGSSWYMVEYGSSITVDATGPWETWRNAAREDADPYTRAHFARAGVLPLSSEFAQTFVARIDSDGRALHSSCEYLVEGPDIATHWWSLAVFDTRGRLIPNTADRYAFTSDTMAINPNGTFAARLARDARPGNWLPIGGAGRITIVLTLIDLGQRRVVQDGDIEAQLPTIKRVSC